MSVTAKMDKESCNVTPGAAAVRRNPGMVRTRVRNLLVQNRSLNVIGVRPVDVAIEPDVTGFEPTEFMRATEMATVGEAAALEQIPRIEQLLTRLDPQLFRPPEDAPTSRRHGRPARRVTDPPEPLAIGPRPAL